jgi:hypothetical protein
LAQYPTNQRRLYPRSLLRVMLRPTVASSPHRYRRRRRCHTQGPVRTTRTAPCPARPPPRQSLHGPCSVLFLRVAMRWRQFQDLSQRNIHSRHSPCTWTEGNSPIEGFCANLTNPEYAVNIKQSDPFALLIPYGTMNGICQRWDRSDTISACTRDTSCCWESPSIEMAASAMIGSSISLASIWRNTATKNVSTNSIARS